MKYLKDLREDHDLTQSKIAQLLNCSQATYSRYETGDLDIPIEALKKLALFYNTSIDYLTEFTDDKTPHRRIDQNKKN